MCVWGWGGGGGCRSGTDADGAADGKQTKRETLIRDKHTQTSEKKTPKQIVSGRSASLMRPPS